MTRSSDRAVAAVLFACGTRGLRQAESRVTEEPTVPAVEAVQARYGALPLRERLTGTVRARGQVAIYPEASGPVVERAREERRRRESGRSARPDPRRDFAEPAPAVRSGPVIGGRQSRDRAQATVDDLERRFERSEQPGGVETSSARRSSRPCARSSPRPRPSLATGRGPGAAGRRANWAASRESVRQTVVRAPIDGTVGRRNAEVGMFVTGSTPLFTIGRLDEHGRSTCRSRRRCCHPIEVGPDDRNPFRESAGYR